MRKPYWRATIMMVPQIKLGGQAEYKEKTTFPNDIISFYLKTLQKYF